MLTTEEEAKTKQCRVIAAALVPGQQGLAVTAGMLNVAYGTCIGSKCMQWRWSDTVDKKAARRGFCGASGKPMWESTGP